MSSMTATSWKTIKSATYVQDLLFLQGRLNAEGIHCQLKDENTLTVQPFFANAIGGVKLMVRQDQAKQALEIIDMIEKGDASFAFENETQRINQELQLRELLRHHQTNQQIPLEKLTDEFSLLKIDEIEAICRDEKAHKVNRKPPAKNIFARLFSASQSSRFYLEQELITMQHRQTNDKGIKCPRCGSFNTKYGYMNQQTLSLVSLILSFLIGGGAPAPGYKKKHHCFSCHHEFASPKSTNT